MAIMDFGLLVRLVNIAKLNKDSINNGTETHPTSTPTLTFSTHNYVEYEDLDSLSLEDFTTGKFEKEKKTYEIDADKCCKCKTI